MNVNVKKSKTSLNPKCIVVRGIEIKKNKQIIYQS